MPAAPYSLRLASAATWTGHAAIRHEGLAPAVIILAAAITVTIAMLIVYVSRTRITDDTVQLEWRDDWWPEFERQFRAYALRRELTQAAPRWAARLVRKARSPRRRAWPLSDRG